MSKTGWIVLIVCLCLVLCICAGLVLAGRMASSLFSRQSDSGVDTANTKNYKELNNPFAADGVYAVQMNELTDLTIDWINGSVTIELTDGNVIRIEETATSAISEKNALRYGVSGTKLRIQACKKNHTGKLPLKALIVYLPRALAEGLKDLQIDTVSASVSAWDLDLEELEINTISGRTFLHSMTAVEAELNTVSGQTDVRDASFDSLKINSISAPTNITAAARKVKASSVSGRMDLALENGSDVGVSTVSGPVALSFDKTPRKINVDTTSGRIDLKLPADASCAIELDTVSGKLYLNEEAVGSKQLTFGEGAAEFEVDSISGSVYVTVK